MIDEFERDNLLPLVVILLPRDFLVILHDEHRDPVLVAVGDYYYYYYLYHSVDSTSIKIENISCEETTITYLLVCYYYLPGVVNRPNSPILHDYL